MTYRPLGLTVASIILVSSGAVAAEPADTKWAEIESLMKGPKERPKTREEMMSALKKMLPEFDAKAEAFTKEFPSDPRRWKLSVHTIQSNSLRGMVDLPTKSEDEISKIADEVLAAADADAQTKATVSFFRAVSLADSPKFAAAADGHLKAFPDFPANEQLKSRVKAKEQEQEVKSKPLELKFTGIDGKEVDLQAMRGKVVLVDFWATWCGPCVAEMPKVIAAYEKLHGKGFEIVGISFDEDKAALEKFVKEKGVAWPQYFDGKGWKNEFGKKYSINSIPRMWLVDKKGMVVDTNAREKLAEKVEKLLAE